VSQRVGNFTSSPSAPVTVSVHAMPSIFLPAIGPFCKDATPVVLQRLPTGLPGYYSYSGPGVTGNTFIPADANPGSNTVLHVQYTQLFGNDACADTVSIRITALDCVTSLKEETNSHPNILIFSGRQSNEFIIQSTANKMLAFIITDINGREVMALKNLETNDILLDLANHSRRVYVLTIKHEWGYLSRKIVKLE
jgi:hypothetical protein